MRVVLIFFLGSFSFLQPAISEDARVPRVPSELTVAGMKLKITEAARRDIQKDVDALHQSPKYFNIKVDRVKLYFPIIEKIFKEEGIPDDFKFLAVQESALISDAVSSANAVGFWQFKDFTGREVGLRIDRNIDERLNIVSSTYGVSKYFKRHNFYFKNWIYTILAHMTGRGGAMKHVDKKQFGAKKMTIDKNAHWYVKRYLAHLIAFRDEINGKHSKGLSLIPYEKGEGKNLEQIAKNFKVDYDELSKYNKWLKRGKIPDEKTYTILIPTTKKVKIPSKKEPEPEVEPLIVEKKYPNLKKRLNTSKTIFIKINGIQSILAKKTDNADSLSSKGNITLSRFLKYNDLTIDTDIKEGEIYYLKPKRNRANIYFYTVSQKESMWEISQKFGIKLSKLAKLNRMLTIDEPEVGRVMWLREKRPKDTPIEIKEIIEIPAFVDNDPPPRPMPKSERLPDAIEKEANEKPKVETKLIVKEQPSISPTSIKTEVHIVEPGETLYSISKDYNVSIDKIMLWNQINSSTLQPGQKLKLLEPNESNPQVPDEIEVNQEEVYVVKSGDTLYGIARDYGVSVDDIIQWNELKTNNLHLGQRLKIYNDNIRNSQVNEITLHVVESGDTLYGISKKYNVSVKHLLELNDKDNTNLEIGEKIRIK